MKLTKEELDTLDELTEAHQGMQRRLNEIVFIEGAKLFAPIQDMSLDPADIEEIENKLFELLEKYPEFGQYIETRKKTLPRVLEIMKKMKDSGADDWRKLVEIELGMEITKSVRLMAGKMGLSYGSKVYIQ